MEARVRKVARVFALLGQALSLVQGSELHRHLLIVDIFQSDRRFPKAASPADGTASSGTRIRAKPSFAR
jgi:hypothetical protein